MQLLHTGLLKERALLSVVRSLQTARRPPGLMLLMAAKVTKVKTPKLRWVLPEKQLRKPIQKQKQKQQSLPKAGMRPAKANRCASSRIARAGTQRRLPVAGIGARRCVDDNTLRVMAAHGHP